MLVFRLDSSYYLAESLEIAMDHYLTDESDPFKKFSDVYDYELCSEECANTYLYDEILDENIKISDYVGRQYLSGDLEPGFLGRI